MKRAIPARYGVGAALLVVGAVATHAWFNQTHGLDSLREYRSAPEPIAPPPGDDRLYGVIEPLGSPPTPGGNAQMEQHERTVFSQHGEDGVIERIFELIPPTTTYAVEFGGGDGVTLSNVRNLIVNQGWSALMIDGDPGLVERCAEIYADVPAAKCRYAWVYPGNVELLFEEQGVPKDLDLLVIDIDSNDWYVWRAIHDFRPKVVQVEYNGLVAPPQRMVVDFHPMNYLDGPTSAPASSRSTSSARRKATSSSTRTDSASTCGSSRRSTSLASRSRTTRRRLSTGRSRAATR